MKKIAWILLLILYVTFLPTGFAQNKAYIIDTDMGFDDWLAVLYVLRDPNVSLKAVSVDCQGETYCPAGASNAAKLMMLARHHVPILMGKTRSFSQYDFPKPIRDYASAMRVPGFDYLKSGAQTSYPLAAKGIALLLADAGKKHQRIDIISIGTATNIADAYQYAKKHHLVTLFKDGLGMIYKGGGAFGKIVNGHVTNRDVPGNIPIPGIYQSQDAVAEWNIYANAKAMQVLLSAKLPMTFIPNNATNAVPMNWDVYRQFKVLGKKSQLAKFTANAMQTLFAMQHSWESLNFWDTAVTVAAIYPQVVTKEYVAPVRVKLNDSKDFGETVVSKSRGWASEIFYHVKADAIYRHVFAVF